MKVLKKGWRELFPEVNEIVIKAIGNEDFYLADNIKHVMFIIENNKNYIEALGEEPPKFKGYAGGGAFSSMSQEVADRITYYSEALKIATEKKNDK